GTAGSPDMSVSIKDLKLSNPVMTASGTFGYGEEFSPYVDLGRLGAIIVKGLSLEPRSGNPPPRIIETAAGMLNAIGLQNIGVREFVDEKLPWLGQYGIPVIANVYGESIEDYCRVCEILSGSDGVSAVEINISCPNVKKGGVAFGTDPEMAAEVTRSVKSATDLPVIIKLTPNVTDIAAIAESVEAAGADAVSLINTLTGMSVDVETRLPHLRNVTGGLSGPAIKPVALRMVWQVVKKVNIPVIGIGGIMTASDALEFLIVGARAVQVGTANFVNPTATIQIIEGIEDYLRRNELSAIGDLIGTLRLAC
ncbi:MAG: dihydroorotate dehydrogenase, partial [Syntrophales bacterium]|nr:dihydroorotate dehydrogenase [Syntrophales bacterium]